MPYDVDELPEHSRKDGSPGLDSDVSQHVNVEPLLIYSIVTTPQQLGGRAAHPWHWSVPVMTYTYVYILN